jgi:hypothetical protein
MEMVECGMELDPLPPSGGGLFIVNISGPLHEVEAQPAPHDVSGDDFAGDGPVRRMRPPLSKSHCRGRQPPFIGTKALWPYGGLSGT